MSFFVISKKASTAAAVVYSFWIVMSPQARAIIALRSLENKANLTVDELVCAGNLLHLVGKMNFHQLKAMSSFAVDALAFSSEMEGISNDILSSAHLCDTYELVQR